MFLNKSVFKKLIKSAYKFGDLRVGRIYDGLVVVGAAWSVWMDEEYVPNWIKAALIEIIGTLPFEDELIHYKKGEIDQMVLVNDQLNLPKRFTAAKEPYIVTPVICSNGYHALQTLQHKQSLELKAVNKDLFDLIDASNLNEECPASGQWKEDYEGAPSGPATSKDKPWEYMWANSCCVVSLMGMNINGGAALTVMHALAEIDFAKEEAKKWE